VNAGQHHGKMVVAMEEMRGCKNGQDCPLPQTEKLLRMHHAGNKNAGDKNLRQRRAKAQTRIVSSRLQRSFVLTKPYTTLSKEYSSSYNKAMAQNPVKQKVKTEPKKCVSAKSTATQDSTTDSFSHLGAQDPLVLRLATESSNPRRLLC
jgi:hypothetical protein